MGDEIERLRPFLPLFEDDANHRGNDFAGLLDNDGIADADVFAADLVFIVEGGPRNGAAAEEDGLEFGDRGEHAGAADLNRDGLQDRHGLFRRIFVSARPLRRARGVTGGLAQRALVELDHRAIRLEGKAVAQGVQLGDRVHDLLDGMRQPGVRVHGKPEVLQPAQQFFLGLGNFRIVAHRTDPVAEIFEPAFGDDARIELLERTGGDVARIGVRFLAGGHLLGGDFLKGRKRQIDFAADFEHFGRLGTAFQAQGNAADGAQILGDLIAGLAIAARGALGEDTILIAQADRQAIDLRFDQPDEGFGGQGVLAAQFVFDADYEFAHGLGAIAGKDIVERKHGHAVADGLEAGDGLAADALGGRIGREQFGIRFFEIPQLAKKRVVFRIGNGGRGFLVIAAIVLLDFGAELGDAFTGVWHGEILAGEGI